MDNARILRSIIVAMGSAAIIGLGVGLLLGDGGVSGAALGGLIALVLAFGMSTFEIVWATGKLGRRIREAPFLVVVLSKSAAWIAILLPGIAVPLVVFTDQNLVQVVDRAFVGAAAAGLVGASLINFLFQINALLGRGVLLRFVTGRYHRPREEERIFLFLDLRSSTAITERIGNLRFHSLLRRFVSDVTAPVLRSGGEIYRYVGDEVIVTWSKQRGSRNAACLRCYFSMLLEIEQNEEDYLKDFGVAPEFWAGMHMGPVVSGEIGTSKQEIVYLGDTMNTTARIEQACSKYVKPLLISGTLLSALTLPKEWVVENLGKVGLRGVSEAVELFSVAESVERKSATHS